MEGTGQRANQAKARPLSTSRMTTKECIQRRRRTTSETSASVTCKPWGSEYSVKLIHNSINKYIWKLKCGMFSIPYKQFVSGGVEMRLTLPASTYST